MPSHMVCFTYTLISIHLNFIDLQKDKNNNLKGKKANLGSIQ